MPTPFPQRTIEHQIEDISINFFKHYLPSAWTCERPNPDYGIDLRVGIAVNNCINGREFVVQVKASAEAQPGDAVELKIKVSTLNLLRDHLSVAVVVKYIEAEREAYWMLLKDFTLQPLHGQETVTIRIPRSNRISERPWTQIAEYVEKVHLKKLRANS